MTPDPTVPYPWPYDGAVDPERLALVIAGAQAGWAARSGRAAEVASVLAELASAVRPAGGLVVAVRHSPPLRCRASLPPVRGSDGWQLLDLAGVDLAVDAAGVDGFYGGPLDAVLRAHGVDHLAVGGFGHELAVDSTLRSANDRGYECLLLADAVAPLDEATSARALASVTMSGGIFGAVGTSSFLLSALRRHDPTPEVVT